jgi:hypothetical protein
VIIAETGGDVSAFAPRTWFRITGRRDGGIDRYQLILADAAAGDQDAARADRR